MTLGDLHSCWSALPETRAATGFEQTGSIYLLNLSTEDKLPSLEQLDGLRGTRLLSGNQHSGLGQRMIFDDQKGPSLAILEDAPYSLLLRSAPSPSASSFLSSDVPGSAVLPIGQLQQLIAPKHLQFSASGGRLQHFATGHRLQAEHQQDARLTRLVYSPGAVQGALPQINFGDGIEDQFVLTGTALNLDFQISDPTTPADQLILEVDLDTTSPLIEFKSVGFTGTGEFRTLIIGTIAGEPDGSTPVTVRVLNIQGQSAEAPFVLNVINSSVPEINAGLGLTDEIVIPGDTLVKDFQVTDLLFFPDNLSYSASSSNPALIPPASILFDGDGSLRLITIPTDPASNGQSLITVEVSNPLAQVATADFLVTVGTVGGGAPSINGGAGIPAQFVTAGQQLDVPFTRCPTPRKRQTLSW